MLEFTLDPTLTAIVVAVGPVVIALATKAGADSEDRKIIAAVGVALVLVAAYVAAKWPTHWATFLAEGTALWLGVKAAYELIDSVMQKATGQGLNDTLLPSFGLGPAVVELVGVPSDVIADRLAAALAEAEVPL